MPNLSDQELTTWYRVKLEFRARIRQSPLLYKSYLIFTKGWLIGYPRVGDEIFITGYQRSGNTFAKLFVQRLYPDLRVSCHIHNIASLKTALRVGVPLIISIRNPIEAVASSISKRVDGPNMSLNASVAIDLDDYQRYYEFFESIIEEVELIKFEDVVVGDEEFISLVARKPGSDAPPFAVQSRAKPAVEVELNNNKRSDGDRDFRSDYKDEMKESTRMQVGAAAFDAVSAVYFRLLGCIHR